MKQLRLSRDGQRLVLVIASSLPLKAAARQIRAAHHEGDVEGDAVFSYPLDAEVCASLLETFEPEVAPGAAMVVNGLLEHRAAMVQAEARKSETQTLDMDPILCTEPMQHQVQALNFCSARFTAGAQGNALLMEQGTGKSLVAVGLANWLHELGLIKWVLVVAVNSVKGTWAAEDGEVAIHSQRPALVRVLRGSRDKRQSYLRRLLDKDHEQLLWVVTNFDQFAVNSQRRSAAATQYQGTLDIIKAAGPGLFIGDETSAVKNPLALTTVSVQGVANLFKYRLILNGTPVECTPLDVWSQFELLEPGCLGFNTALAFDRTYAVRQRIEVKVRGGGSRYVSTVTGHQNLDDLQRRISRVSFRALAKDCMDLPPVTARTLPVELSAQQGKLLRQLKSDMMAEMDDGKLIDGRNILARMQKMAQIIGGWVKAMNPDGTDAGWQTLETNPFMDALEDYLKVSMADPSRKVVVFAEHPSTEIRGIANMFERSGWGPVTFHGGVSEEDRDKRRQKFKDDPACRGIIGQWGPMSRGLNLTAADTVVFYGLTFKYGTWAQARKRVDRKGQTRPVTELYLLGLCPPARGNRLLRTLSHVQLEGLRDKKDLADIVTGDRMQSMLEAL